MTLTPAGPPRGLLHVDPANPPFRHWRYLPSTDLSPFVEHFWIVEWDLRGRTPHVQSTLPHPSVHLALEAGHARIVGVCRGQFTQTLDGRGGVFGVKFRPGGFHPFCRASTSSISSLTNKTMDAALVLGADVERLASEVLAAERTTCKRTSSARFSGRAGPRWIRRPRWPTSSFGESSRTAASPRLAI